MWTSAWRNRISLAAAFSVAWAARIYAAGPVSSMSILFPDGSETFSAGVSTTTRLITCFGTGGAAAPDAGETVTLELLAGGQVISGGMSPTSFITQNNTTVYGTASGLPAFTFFRSGTDLQIRATSAGGVTATSGLFDVATGAASKLIVLAPGETLQPGRNPGTFTGKSGTATPQEANQAFAVTVHLTDAQFNQVSGNNTVSFAANDPALITLPADFALSNGIGSGNVTISAPSTTRTLTVTSAGLTPGTADVTTAGPPAQELFPHPNPFNPHTGTTTLRFRISDTPKNVIIKIFNQFGQKVWQRDVDASVGFNDQIKWDGRNDSGNVVASGVYYAVLEVDGSVKSKKRVGVVK